MSILAIVPAFGDIVYTLSPTNPNPSGDNGGNKVSATAAFSISGNTLTIVLSNLTPIISDVAGVLDGFEFTLGGGTAALNTASLAASATAFIDCNDGPCAIVPTFDDDQHNTTIASPYTWALSNSYHLEPNGFHPGGIADSLGSLSSVNASVFGNGPHNDLLEGPVTFSMTFGAGTLPTSVTGATFLFGTGPDSYAGTKTTDKGLTPTVPEPSSVLLLGSAGLGILMALKRRFASLKQS